MNKSLHAIKDKILRVKEAQFDKEDDILDEIVFVGKESVAESEDDAYLYFPVKLKGDGDTNFLIPCLERSTCQATGTSL